MKSQGGEGEDPDSRMDSERADRRDKKGGKGKVGIQICICVCICMRAIFV